MRRLLVALTVTFVVVASTGVYQAFEYYPRGSQWWSDVHRAASILLVLLLLAALFVWLRNRATLCRGVVQVLALLVGTIAVIAAFVTGPTIHWEQLALWKVTVGSEIGGVFEDGIKFVVADGQVHGVDTFRRSVWAHVVVLPVLFVGALAVVWYFSTRAAAREAHDDVEVMA